MLQDNCMRFAIATCHPGQMPWSSYVRVHCIDTFANKTSLPSLVLLQMSTVQREISPSHSVKSGFSEVRGLRTSELWSVVYWLGVAYGQ